MRIAEMEMCLTDVVGSEIVWKDGVTTVVMGDGVEVFVHKGERDELTIYGYLERMTEKRFRSCAATLLQANLFADGGSSIILAYDPAKGRVVLWDRMELSTINLADFQERFSSLYLAILDWTGEIFYRLGGSRASEFDLSILPR